MNNNHTPGPWEMTNIPGTGRQIKTVIKEFGDRLISLFDVPSTQNVRFSLNNENQLVALLSYEEWVQFPSVQWNGMQEANGKLMAAAPDLLDSCDKALTCLINSNDIDHSEIEEVITKLQSAITKATGEEF